MTNLKDLRQNKGLTQQELASKLQRTKTCICDWERGRCEPPIEDLIKLADLFGCSIDYLVGRENDFGNIVVSNGASVPALTKEETWLLDMFRKLDEISQYKVLGYIQAFI